MSQALINQIKKHRQTSVKVGEINFDVRRPTDLEMVLLTGKIDQSIILEEFVVGWFGVTELDVVAGGDGTPVPFDKKLFMEWVADRPELWPPLTNAIIESYQAHQQQREETAKNS